MVTTRSSAIVLAATLALAAADPVVLPAPEMTGGRQLMEALHERRTVREFDSRPLPKQILSNLLWAAFGVNRPDSGGRTAPSAWDHREIDLYVFTHEGAYLYLPEQGRLQPVLEGDRREATGAADFVKTAGLSIVYVADHGRTPRTPVWEKEKFAYVSTGFISQNVYLFCASAGLGTVIHDSADKGALATLLGLRRDQQIILAQAVGYPKGR